MGVPRHLDRSLPRNVPHTFQYCLVLHTHRELSHLLADEQRTLGKTKAYLKQQERNLKERRATLQQTHREWSQGIKSHGGRKVMYYTQTCGLYSGISLALMGPAILSFIEWLSFFKGQKYKCKMNITL